MCGIANRSLFHSCSDDWTSSGCVRPYDSVPLPGKQSGDYLELILKSFLQQKQFGKAIGDFQGMQFQYAAIATEIEAARLLTYK